ncbi:MAG: exosortase H [Acidobacteria bacterium]|nr:exosortase H [Acidobacteriota bacterium]
MQLKQLWNRAEIRFLIVFTLILTAAFTAVALKPVNDGVVLPYTSFVARVSASVLSLLGEQISVAGCRLSSPRFAVTIYNGCNGLITTLIFAAGVLAFPAGWRSKVLGVIGGSLAIQLLNLIRIISLYYIGAFAPRYFSEAHIFIWQTIVILGGVALWLAWARRFGGVDDAQS